MMRYRPWPFLSFEIRTPLSPEKVLGILRVHTEPRRFMRWGNDNRYFEGEINKDRFKIRRIIRYRNSFLPVVTGIIIHDRCGSLVKIKMRLSMWVAAFMSIWLGWFACFGLIVSKANFFESLGRGDQAVIFPLGMIAFGVALTSGCFWFEASKQQDELISLMTP